MKIYGFCYDEKNFVVYNVKVEKIMLNGNFITQDGDVINFDRINLNRPFDHYTLDSEMFFFLDKKIANKVFSYFRKKVIQSIDDEIGFLIEQKNKIQNCKFIPEL